MADGILTQITMAGGAINLAFNTIDASYIDGNYHSWPSTAEMMIIYHCTEYNLAQPVLITKYMYDTLCTSFNTGSGEVIGWRFNNQTYNSMDVLKVIGKNSLNNSSRFYLMSGYWCILVR